MIEKQPPKRQPPERPDQAEPTAPNRLSARARSLIAAGVAAGVVACGYGAVNFWREMNPDESAIVGGVPALVRDTWLKNEGCTAQAGVTCAQQSVSHVAILTQCPEDVAAMRNGAQLATYEPVVATRQEGCVTDEAVIGNAAVAGVLRGIIITPPGNVGAVLYRSS